MPQLIEECKGYWMRYHKGFKEFADELRESGLKVSKAAWGDLDGFIEQMDPKHYMRITDKETLDKVYPKDNPFDFQERAYRLVKDVMEFLEGRHKYIKYRDGGNIFNCRVMDELRDVKLEFVEAQLEGEKILVYKNVNAGKNKKARIKRVTCRVSFGFSEEAV